MRQTIILLIFGFIFTTGANAELPLEEIWSVDLDGATVLGNAWTGENGESMALVGDGWRARLIADGEIIWTSDSLAGPVTALARIPYADGEQILVAVVETFDEPEETFEGDILGYGHLLRFDMDSLRLQSDTQLLHCWAPYGLRDDRRCVAKLDYSPEMLDDENHPILAVWNVFWGGHRNGSRRFGLLGYINDDGPGYNNTGFTNALTSYDDANDAKVLVHGWKTYFEYPGDYGGEYSCGLTLMEPDFSILNTDTLSEYKWLADWDAPPDRSLEILGMNIAQTDGENKLYLGYSDSSHAYLCEMTLPELETLQTKRLPDDWQRGQMLSYQWTEDDDALTNLLLIDEDGSVLIFDAETLTQIGDGQLPQPYIRSLAVDFEDDGEQELLVLSEDRLTCYRVAPLAAPHESATTAPSDFTLFEPYPNPFNSTVTIAYELSNAGFVSLKAYDINGVEVGNLINETKTAGTYAAIWDASSLPSGIYFCRINTNGVQLTRKLVLVR